MKPSQYVAALEQYLEQHADPANKEKMVGYMKNQFDFFGIKTPQRKALLKEFVAENGNPGLTHLHEFAVACFDSEYREVLYCGIELIGKSKKVWEESTIKTFEYMATTQSWWDSVDSINIHCIRPYFGKFPKRRDPQTLAWAKSENFWFQRLSLICQLRLKEEMDLTLVERNIEFLKHSDEFFVQKAIGWILRDYGHSDPDWVKSFVFRHELKPLSKREALKHIA